MCEQAGAAEILEWYDRHARDLPWRVGPGARAAGVRPDPYRVWLSEVMLQQTTVAAVIGYFERFTALWPDVRALADAPEAQVMGEWAGLGYYARARNLVKCARVVAHELGGVFPQERAALEGLPGIGPYTGAAIAAIAFDAPEVVVDGNVERVMARGARHPHAAARRQARDQGGRGGDDARGAARLLCAGGDGSGGDDLHPAHARPAGSVPGARPVRPARPGCRGTCRARRQRSQGRCATGSPMWRGGRMGAWLLERRPDKGLLGGMLGWPGSEWNDAPEPAPPLDADWQELPEEARHVFTHFELRLKVCVADVPEGRTAVRGEFHPAAAFRPSDLPRVMRKVFDLARGRLENAR